jgi:hypothetical protein
MAAGRVDDMDREAALLPLGENLNQPTGRNQWLQNETGSEHDAATRRRHLGQQHAVVGIDRPTDTHAHRLPGLVLELPLISRGRVGIGKARVAQQIFRVSRVPHARQIIVRCGNQQRGLTDMPGDKILAADPPDANRQIEPFFDEIGNTVGKHDIQRDLRIGATKCGKRRRQAQRGQGDRRSQAQATARVAGFSRHAGFGFLQVGQQLRAALEVGKTFVGRIHAPRRAVDQAHVELHFQLRHMARNRRGGKPDRSAAATKLPASITEQKTRIASNLSIQLSR